MGAKTMTVLIEAAYMITLSSLLGALVASPYLADRWLKRRRHELHEALK